MSAFPWLILGIVLIVVGVALVPGWWGALVAFVGGACVGIYELTSSRG